MISRDIRTKTALRAESTAIIAPAHEELVLAAATSHGPLALSEAEQTELRAGQIPLAQPGVVWVPMVVANERVGVLRVTGMEAGPRQDAVARSRLLNAFAQVAALAVHHDRLQREIAAGLAYQEADALKSALLTAVSHELRTPLASIKAAATGLLDPEQRWTVDAQHELLVSIDEATDRLAAFVGNLLDLSRIEGGALHQTRDWYQLDEFLDTVTNELIAPAERARVQLHIDHPIASGYFDYVQIGQVVVNLVENAAKFSSDDAPITVTASTAGERMVIAVTDEGRGIDPTTYHTSSSACTEVAPCVMASPAPASDSRSARASSKHMVARSLEVRVRTGAAPPSP